MILETFLESQENFKTCALVKGKLKIEIMNENLAGVMLRSQKVLSRSKKIRWTEFLLKCFESVLSVPIK